MGRDENISYYKGSPVSYLSQHIIVFFVFEIYLVEKDIWFRYLSLIRPCRLKEVSCGKILSRLLWSSKYRSCVIANDIFNPRFARDLFGGSGISCNYWLFSNPWCSSQSRKFQCHNKSTHDPNCYVAQPCQNIPQKISIRIGIITTTTWIPETKSTTS